MPMSSVADGESFDIDSFSSDSDLDELVGSSNSSGSNKSSSESEEIKVVRSPAKSNPTTPRHKKTDVKKSKTSINKTDKKSHKKTSKKNNKKSSKKTSGSDDDFQEKRDEILNTLKEINLLTKKTSILVKELETIHKKRVRLVKKRSRKGTDTKSGIVALAPVPQSLRDLLGLDDTPLSRSDVSKLIYKYVHDNNLYSPNTKKIIIPDDAMRKVFGMDKDEIIKFENFQTWLKKAYNENEKKATKHPHKHQHPHHTHKSKNKK